MSDKRYTVAHAMCDYFDVDTRYNREVALFISRREAISMTTNNSAGHVAFDWDAIHDNTFIDGRVDKSCNPHMIHTHPPGHVQMSSTDINMMHGWCMALYIPIYFTIISEVQSHSYHCYLDNKGQLVCNSNGIVDHSDTGLLRQGLAYTMYGLSKRSKDFDQPELDDLLKEISASSFNSEISL